MAYLEKNMNKIRVHQMALKIFWFNDLRQGDSHLSTLLLYST